MKMMWPAQNEIESLLEQVRTGRPDAVDRLLGEFREPLRLLIQRRLDRAVARRVDASDIVQEVLLDAHRRLTDYLSDPKLPFQFWLRQMALDRTIDAHRRHRTAARRSISREQPIQSRLYPDHSSLELAGLLRDPGLTPAADAIRRELQQRFEAALARLPDDDREIVALRHLEQLSNSESAALLGLSPPAASMRYLRAVRRLREILGERPSQPGLMQSCLE